MTKEFTAIVVKSGDWYAGTVKELSGVHSQGKTVEEVLENLKEAVQLIIESNTKRFSESADEFIERQIAVTI